MLRNILAVIAGILGGGLIVGLIQSVGHRLYGTTESIDRYDTAAMTEFIESLPLEALLFVLVAHAFGAFMAGLIASKLAETSKFSLGCIAAGFIVLGALMSMFMIPGQPIWLKIIDPLSAVLLGILGSQLGSR